ncbi:uncharacterized protein LOC135360444 [Latimeria chalumnae]|uniref:uncharacterized protein LOC135360444 n=1 Tax=Latimeria chalumnae TaxID=7897 RepID=UPI00313B4E5C
MNSTQMSCSWMRMNMTSQNQRGERRQKSLCIDLPDEIPQGSDGAGLSHQGASDGLGPGDRKLHQQLKDLDQRHQIYVAGGYIKMGRERTGGDRVGRAKETNSVCGSKAGRGEQAGGHTITAQFQRWTIFSTDVQQAETPGGIHEQSAQETILQKLSQMVMDFLLTSDIWPTFPS